jgi:alkanesulfonate monooxygenase SsuD/methylene tetrahydromethanopterin reductase-like flavin-dependent oxidoreductase (luciferase family)
MKFGFFPMPQAPLEKRADLLVDEIIEQVERAAETGFDLTLIGQHYLTEEYTELQPFPLLGRLSAVQDSMTLGTGILLLPLHHPIEIAEQMSTLDALAGDTVLGLGMGYREAEFSGFGIPKEERVPRFVEGVQIVRRLLREPNVTFDGRAFSVEDATINPRPSEPPPIWIAANADKAVRRAAKLGDAWFVNPHSTLSEIATQKSTYDTLRADGEETAVPVLREIIVARTTDRAQAHAHEYLGAKYSHYIDWGQNEAMTDSTEFKQEFEQLAEDRFLIGTPAEVCEQIEQLQARLDVSHLVCRLQPPGLAHEDVLQSLELFGDEIIPSF